MPTKRVQAAFGRACSGNGVEVSLYGQLTSFAMAGLLGVLVGLLYDALAIIATRLRFKLFRAVFDAIFCMCVVLLLFAFAMTVGGGELRIFALLGFALGGLLYYLVFSALVRSVGGFVLDTLIKMLLFLLSPLFALFKLLKKIHKYFKNLFHLFTKRDIIGLNALQGEKARERAYKRGGELGKGEEEKAYRLFYQARHRGFLNLRRNHTDKSSGSDKRSEKRGSSAKRAARRGEREEFSSAGGYRL